MRRFYRWIEANPGAALLLGLGLVAGALYLHPNFHLELPDPPAPPPPAVASSAVCVPLSPLLSSLA